MKGSRASTLAILNFTRIAEMWPRQIAARFQGDFKKFADKKIAETKERATQPPRPSRFPAIPPASEMRKTRKMEFMRQASIALCRNLDSMSATERNPRGIAMFVDHLFEELEERKGNEDSDREAG